MRWLYRLEKEKVEVKEDKGVGLQSEVTRVSFFFFLLSTKLIQTSLLSRHSVSMTTRIRV